MHFDILFRAIIIYFIVLIVLKFMGKREIGQLSLFDFVVLLIIADLSVIGVEDKEVAFIFYLLPVFAIAIIQKIIASILLKVPKIRNFFDGKSSMIIIDGKLNIKEMKKQSYNIDDLVVQTRLKNIRSISEIRYLILEPNGEISIFKWKDFESQNSTPAIVVDNKATTSNVSNQTKNKDQSEIYPFPLITSGVIDEEYLKVLNLSKDWLIHELKIKGYPDYKQILYCNYEYGSLFIAETCNF